MIRANPQTKVAAYSGKQTAEKIELQCKAYRKAAPLSSLKMQIGELLLYLQTPLSESERWNYWQVFESGLRRLLSYRRPYRIPQSAYGEGSGVVASTKAS